ncbi:MAG TPA: hypothetical protein PK442_14735 [Synergistales bacterium]|nr:hypothetical protein [Synergistales bacterium]
MIPRQYCTVPVHIRMNVFRCIQDALFFVEKNQVAVTIHPFENQKIRDSEPGADKAFGFQQQNAVVV